MSRCAKCWDEASLIARSDQRPIMAVYAEKLREHDHSYPPSRQQVCEWEEDENGIWHTQCVNYGYRDRAFEITEGTPADNGFSYCPYCGALLKQVLYSEVS